MWKARMGGGQHGRRSVDWQRGPSHSCDERDCRPKGCRNSSSGWHRYRVSGRLFELGWTIPKSDWFREREGNRPRGALQLGLKPRWKGRGA